MRRERGGNDGKVSGQHLGGLRLEDQSVKDVFFSSRGVAHPHVSSKTTASWT